MLRGAIIGVAIAVVLSFGIGYALATLLPHEPALVLSALIGVVLGNLGVFLGNDYGYRHERRQA